MDKNGIAVSCCPVGGKGDQNGFFHCLLKCYNQAGTPLKKHVEAEGGENAENAKMRK